MFNRLLPIAAAILTISTAAAFAQANSPVGSGRVSPETYATSPSAPAADANPNTPGATGTALVPGDASTIAGDRNATAEERTGLTPAGNGGGDGGGGGE